MFKSLAYEFQAHIKTGEWLDRKHPIAEAPLYIKINFEITSLQFPYPTFIKGLVFLINST